jgi:hypothetical protein
MAKVNQSHYRPWHAHRIPGGWGSQILRQSAHEGGKVVFPTTGRLYPQEIFLLLISVRGWVKNRAMVRPKECQWKIPVTPSGIDVATFRFVAQCMIKYRGTNFEGHFYSNWMAKYLGVDGRTFLKSRHLVGSGLELNLKHFVIDEKFWNRTRIFWFFKRWYWFLSNFTT